MIRRYFVILLMLGFFITGSNAYGELAYNFKFKGIDGEEINLANYKDKVLVKL